MRSNSFAARTYLRVVPLGAHRSPVVSITGFHYRARRHAVCHCITLATCNRGPPRMTHLLGPEVVAPCCPSVAGACEGCGCITRPGTRSGRGRLVGLPPLHCLLVNPFGVWPDSALAWLLCPSTERSPSKYSSSAGAIAWLTWHSACLFLDFYLSLCPALPFLLLLVSLFVEPLVDALLWSRSRLLNLMPRTCSLGCGLADALPS